MPAKKRTQVYLRNKYRKEREDREYFNKLDRDMETSQIRELIAQTRGYRR